MGQSQAKKPRPSVKINLKVDNHFKFYENKLFIIFHSHCQKLKVFHLARILTVIVIFKVGYFGEVLDNRGKSR